MRLQGLLRQRPNSIPLSKIECKTHKHLFIDALERPLSRCSLFSKAFDKIMINMLKAHIGELRQNSHSDIN